MNIHKINPKGRGSIVGVYLGTASSSRRSQRRCRTSAAPRPPRCAGASASPAPRTPPPPTCTDPIKQAHATMNPMYMYDDDASNSHKFSLGAYLRRMRAAGGARGVGSGEPRTRPASGAGGARPSRRRRRRGPETPLSLVGDGDERRRRRWSARGRGEVAAEKRGEEGGRRLRLRVGPTRAEQRVGQRAVWTVGCWPSGLNRTATTRKGVISKTAADTGQMLCAPSFSKYSTPLTF